MRFFLLLLLFSGCMETRLIRKCSKCPKVVEVKDSIHTVIKDTTIIRDSIITLPPDSAWYYALIECVDNKPVIKSESKSGKQITSTITQDTLLRLRIDCEREKQEIEVQLRDKITKELTKEMQFKKEVITQTVNILTWWQKLLIACGGLFLIEWAFRIGFFIAKKNIMPI